MFRLRKARRRFPNGHSEPTDFVYNEIHVKIVPQGYDNYGYIIWHEQFSTECVVVDVYDASVFIRILKETNRTPAAILCTHWHWDHTIGNGALLNEYPNLNIYAYMSEPVHRARKRVDHGDAISEAGLEFYVVFVPGHTNGHVAYRMPLHFHDLLFTGDFLFCSGIGRLFEGSDEQLLPSLLVVKSWRRQSLIFPGHEYAKQNLEFSMTVDVDNEELREMYSRACTLRQSKKPVNPLALDDEFSYNPFLRLTEESITKGLENLGYTIAPPQTHKRDIPLDADIVNFNRQINILQVLRTAKEDYDAKPRRQEANETVAVEVHGSSSTAPAES